jgi:hypothetical protein
VFALIVDLGKKLLIAVIAAPILTVAAVFYSDTILVAATSFDADWRATYWYLILLGALLGVAQGYALFKRRGLFPWIVGVAILLMIAFAMHRLNVAPLIGGPLWIYFLLLWIVLFQLAVIAISLVWWLVAQTYAASRI